MRLWIVVVSGATLVHVVLGVTIQTAPVEALVETELPREVISEGGPNDNEVATGTETESIASATVKERSSGDERDCGGNLDCEERKLVAIVDKVDSQDSILLVPGMVTLDKKDDSKNTAPDEGSQDLEVRLNRYLRSHTLSLHILGSNFQMGLERFASRRGDVTEGRIKLRRLLVPLLLLANIPLGVLFLAFAAAVVLVAFHGLWSGLAAMMVSAGVGLKLLLEKDSAPSPRVSVGVVRAPLPLDVVHHDYLHHGWSRAGAAAAPLVDPYRGYVQRGILERDYLDRPMRR